MGRQASIIKISGTVSNVTFYSMGGKGYVRSKSSLDAKRVKRDPAFKNSRAAAAVFGVASRIGSAIYRLLPPAKRKIKVYRGLTGKAMRLLKEGKDEEEVVRLVKAEFGVIG